MALWRSVPAPDRTRRAGLWQSVGILKRGQVEEQKKREALAHKMFAKRLKNSDPSMDTDSEKVSPEEKRRQQDAKASQAPAAPTVHSPIPWE